jgi:hypothetical protein
MKGNQEHQQTTKSSPPLRTIQGTWAQNPTEKAHVFANHLMQVFQPHTSEHTPDEREELIQILENPCQLEPPINCLKRTEVQAVINSIHPKTSPRYDLITSKISKNCPLLEFNTKPNCSLQSCSKGTSQHNGKYPK